ncbi:MAG: hypothetical protein VR64_05140 [Desulfatitalea sp. BRH_c12]|nr:MAG: hypothetical protein VR64_05140 [Desulfatitalea sp. BRH_c12]
MRRLRTIAAMVGMLLAMCSMALADTIAGTWTKTTHPDTHNIVLLYSDSEIVKAIGYAQVGGVPAYWYGEGTFRKGQLALQYHYSAEATPFGWEPEGRMLLTVTADGTTLRGTATSRSGNWSESIEMRRISFVKQR